MSSWSTTLSITVWLEQFEPSLTLLYGHFCDVFITSDLASSLSSSIINLSDDAVVFGVSDGKGRFAMDSLLR